MKKTYVTLTLFFTHMFFAQAPEPGEPLWNILAQTQDSQCTTDSKLDNLSLDFSGVFTALAVINSQLSTDISKLEEIAIVTIDPFIALNAIESKLEIAESLIDPIQSTADLLDDCIGIPITQADVGTTGYSITTGGKYFLAENITFSPASGIPAIEIDADNVTLDLNGFTITQGNNQMNVIGVEIINARADILIQNGTIRNTIGEGISCTTNFNNLTLNNLNILNAGVGTAGMGIDASDGIALGSETTSSQNLIITNCLVDNCQDEGIDMDRVTNIIIRDCIVNGARGDAGIGFRTQCQNIFITNCTLNNNLNSGLLIAAQLSAKNIVINGCRTFNNGADGFEIRQPLSPSNIAFTNNQIYNNGRHGINLIANTLPARPIQRCVIAYNYIANNVLDGIHLDKSNVDDNFVFRNTFVENGSNSIDNATGATNSFLGNYAFKSSGTNYVAGGSTINSTAVNTNSAFSTQPVFWRNINATP